MSDQDTRNKYVSGPVPKSCHDPEDAVLAVLLKALLCDLPRKSAIHAFSCTDDLFDEASTQWIVV